MAADNRPLLVEETSIYAFSASEDIEWNFGGLVETYFDSPVDEQINLLFEDSAYSTPGELLRANLITNGQYLLFVVNEFDEELRNGGLAQFIANKPAWIADVAQVLNLLEIADFYDEFTKVIKELRTFFGEGANEPELHRLSIEYDLLAEHLSGTLIDEHYTMRWSDTNNKLYWESSQWSQQLLRLMIDFALAHPSEFRHMQ